VANLAVRAMTHHPLGSNVEANKLHELPRETRIRGFAEGGCDATPKRFRKEAVELIEGKQQTENSASSAAEKPPMA
jgi:hypothetical protein